MEKRAFFKWLMQTPWLAALGAVGLILFVGEIAEKGAAILSVPGWVIQIAGALLYALFLLLVTFHHQQRLDKRLGALEERADEFRANRLAELGDRVELVTEEADRALTKDDDGAILRVRPKIAATMMSLDREFKLGLDIRVKSTDPKTYVTAATAFLFTAWPFLRDGHLEHARSSVAKFNKMRADDRKKGRKPKPKAPSTASSA